jgi:DNA mismatch endonuclease (patch repair protein)
LTDTLTKYQRSKCMSTVKNKDTDLEIIFRKSISKLKIRSYRLHTNLPGTPDLYFPKYRIAVFIDGCFWHGCPSCSSMPASNTAFWKQKIIKNKSRDKAVNLALHKLGIRVQRFWGHEIKKNPEKYANKLAKLIRLRSLNGGL